MLQGRLKAHFTDVCFNEESTQVYLVHEEKVLLFRRARGMGIGVICAPGGKREAGEKVRESAVREFAEETGLTTHPEGLRFMGKLFIHLADENYWVEGDIFFTDQWTGELSPATEEGEAFWSAINEIPWQSMWGDERLWLTAGLAGGRFSVYAIVRGGKIAEHFVELEA